MLYDKLMGREIATRPACPFCGHLVERPAEKPGEMPVGSCTCGAVYAFDETGHSLGTAMFLQKKKVGFVVNTGRYFHYGKDETEVGKGT